MFDKNNLKSALKNFESTISRLPENTSLPYCAELSAVLNNFDCNEDFLKCTTYLYPNIFYQFIQYVDLHQKHTTPRPSWVYIFQGYVISILLPHLKIQQLAQDLFKKLILELYPINPDEMLDFLNNSYPTPAPGTSISRIGEGGGSTVSLCLDLIKKIPIGAIKSFTDIEYSASGIITSYLQLRGLVHEIIVLKRLQNPESAQYITQIKGVTFERCPRILMEYADPGNLADFIIKKSIFIESYHLDFMFQILSALVYIHKIGIIHGDIKPENILLFDQQRAIATYTVKLCDLGSSIFKTPTGIEQGFSDGTPNYTAPEAEAENELAKLHPEKRDIFSTAISWRTMFNRFPKYIQLPKSCAPTQTLMSDPDPERRLTALEAKNQIVNLRRIPFT